MNAQLSALREKVEEEQIVASGVLNEVSRHNMILI